MNDLALAAADYLRAGLSVIALSGKAPNSKYHPHGLLDCISGVPDGDDDLTALEKVFGDAATTGVGVLIPAHTLVADVDSEESAILLTKYTKGETPDTAVALTRNGLHFWFLSPGADQSYWVGNKNLLLRGPGSYVAAPPSKHPDGGVYTWQEPLVVDGRIRALDWLPDDLAAAVAGARLGVEMGIARRNHVDSITNHFTWRLEPKLKFIGTPVMDGILTAVREAREGNRNNLLAWAAMTLAEEGVSYDDAMTPLTDAAVKAGLDRQEIKITIKAAFKRVARRA